MKPDFDSSSATSPMPFMTQLKSFDGTYWWCNWMELLDHFAYDGVKVMLPVFMVVAFSSQAVAQPAMSQTATAPNPLVIAHRGSSAQAPENTLPAFQLAWAQGADAIEADFLLTKDGHIVCFHDKDLLDTIRTADIEHYVWTINDPKLAATYRTQGGDAIITDLPAEMRAALNAPTKHD